jgi:prepilin-type N-terminal cleavage/methylation domain-containing protein
VIFRKQHTPGFTLVELMVSMAIGSMILLAAASLLGGSGASYERVGASVAAEREARALITQLGADLATAHFHKDAVIQLSFNQWPADQLGFLTLQPSGAQSSDGYLGDLCAVNYYLEDLTIGGKTVRCLMRGFRESRETFEALRDDKIADLFKLQNGIDEPVAFGVLSFQARPMVRAPGGGWINWTPTPERNSIPEAVDVRLVIARRDLAGRLKRSSDWDGVGSGGKLGNSADADRNPDLEVYGAMLRYGNHETP